MKKVMLHAVTSKTLAHEIVTRLGRVSGTGGKACFEVEKQKRGYSISFLPEKFPKGHMHPNTDMLSGWIRGYLAR